MSETAVIHIPVFEQSSDLPGFDSAKEVVSVNVRELPEDVDDILEILAAEAAPLNLWLDCARGYLLQGRVDAFQQICSEATRVEVAQEVQRLFGAPPTYEQVQFHCASAGLHMAQAKEEKAPVKRTQLLAAAAQDLAKAQALDSGEQIVILGQGLLHVARVSDTCSTSRAYLDQPTVPRRASFRA